MQELTCLVLGLDSERRFPFSFSNTPKPTLAVGYVRYLSVYFLLSYWCKVSVTVSVFGWSASGCRQVGMRIRNDHRPHSNPNSTLSSSPPIQGAINHVHASHSAIATVRIRCDDVRGICHLKRTNSNDDTPKVHLLQLQFQ